MGSEGFSRRDRCGTRERLGLAVVAMLAAAWGVAGAQERPEAPVPASAEAATREGRSRQAALQAADPGLIRLRARVFDPLRAAPREPAAVLPRGPELRPPDPDEGRPYLVQFHHAPTPADRAAFAARGVRVDGFVPNRALLVRLPAGTAPERLAVPGVRSVTPFRDVYKLAPELVGLVGRTSATPVRIDALLRDGADPDGLRAAVEAAFPGVRVAFVRRRPPVRLLLETPAAALEGVLGALARDPAVRFVERRAPDTLDNDQSVWIGQAYDRVNGPVEAQDPDPKPYPLTATLWSHGLRGAGQVVAVADTGLQVDMCAFHDPSHAVVPQSVPPPGVLAVDPVHRKIAALNGAVFNAFAADGSFRHGTHVAATVAGDDFAHVPGHDHGDGMAPEARLVFEDVGPFVNSQCSTTIVVNSVADLLEQEYAAGARISTNSWGSGTGLYSSGAAEVDDTVWRHEDLLVVFSGGNAGGSGFNNTSSCKNCVAVGAGETWDAAFPSPFGGLDPENMTAFSSRGPTADGRVKPDIVAPGYLVTSSRFPVEYFGDAGDPACDPESPDVCFPGFGGCYVTDTSQTCSTGTLLGTSMAAPTVAGLAALARQYFTDGFHPSGVATPADGWTPGAALLRAVLINGARNMTGRLYERRGAPQMDLGPLADAPSNVQGWGRVMLDDALYFAGDARRSVVRDVANAAGLATGEMTSVWLQVDSGSEPLEITLAWTDPPAEVLAAAALVHDLDLEAVAPDGTRYSGNQWTPDDVNVPGDKGSLADPPGRDAVHNVEVIAVPSPQTGSWRIDVRAVSVAGHAGVDTQGFALVASGAVLDAGGPGPVPDGTTAAGMTASRVDPAGTEIEVMWEAAACAAADHHLLWGDLAGVASLTLAGAACDLGTTGTATWAPPPGDVWFVVVADDGLSVEGSWGRDGDGQVRAPGVVSGSCAMTMRATALSCP